LNGTIKYHFITDSVNAPLQWGLQFAKHPWLAILASFAGLAIEATLLTAAFVRHEWYRLALGLMALSLFCGFFLFMGVFWPAWWILLLGFLPWQWLSTRLRTTGALSIVREASAVAASSTGGWLWAIQGALIAVVIAQQLISSALRLERAPMFSWYDMYSGTFASPKEWNDSRRPTYRVVVNADGARAELPACDPYGEFVREFQRALDGSAEARAKIWQALSGCGENVARAREVVLEGDVRTFDWEQLTFQVQRSVVTLGPLHRDAAESTQGRR
jgi:hypothetical protein